MNVSKPFEWSKVLIFKNRNSLGLFSALATTILLVFVAGGVPESFADSGSRAQGGRLESIVVGGGCFWCTEAVFQNFRGIEKVQSGYAGGATENPTYEQVSGGRTGHAEVIKIDYDPAVIPLDKVITIFFHAHDPTTKDRQGNDAGTQYRSVVLYSTESQKQTIEKVMKEISEQRVWGSVRLTTEVIPLGKFYKAEDYHQNYYVSNSSQPYCSFIIGPKVQKIRKEFKELLK